MFATGKKIDRCIIDFSVFLAKMYSIRERRCSPSSSPPSKGRYWSSDEEDVFDLGVENGIVSPSEMAIWMTAHGHPKTSRQVHTYRQKRLIAETTHQRKRANGQPRPRLPIGYGPSRLRGNSPHARCGSEYEPAIDTSLGFESLLALREDIPLQLCFVVPEIS